VEVTAMANFVAVPAEKLEGFLQSEQFSRTVQGNEVVYVRKSARNPDVQLKVYTSIRVGQTSVRAAGKDAIRVCAVFDNGRKSFGVGKFSPVLRVASVESVLTRLKERLNEAKKRANEWIDKNVAEMARRDALRRDDGVGDIAWKNEYARREARQESEAMMLAEDFQDPCSEPPEALFGDGG
jgi:hypothetical protein